MLVLGTNYVQNQQTDLIWQQEQTLRENAREQAAAAVYDLGELPTLSVVAPKPVALGYHVIAGSFRSQNNADRLVSSLRRKGYYQAARLPKTTSGFHQVSFAAYASQREAYNAKAGIVEDNYPVMEAQSKILKQKLSTWIWQPRSNPSHPFFNDLKLLFF